MNNFSDSWELKLIFGLVGIKINFATREEQSYINIFIKVEKKQAALF